MGGTKWGANIWIWNRQGFGDIRTGDPRQVVMKNAAEDKGHISWEGKDNGSIRPGSSLQINSFEYHRFKASFHSHKDKAIAHFTVQSKPEDQQVWKIEQPRHYQRTPEEPDKGSKPNKGSKPKPMEPQKNILVVRNGLGSTVDIRYDGKFFQRLKPDSSTNINSFEGHTFDAAIGDTVLSAYMVKREPPMQNWVISGEIGHDEYGDEESDEEL